MRTIIIKCILCCAFCVTVLLSCLPDSEDTFAGTLRINISDVMIPATATVNENVQILAVAEAPNGCYGDLRVSMNQLDAQHFFLNALALYQSSSACPPTIVHADTIITFKPTMAGEYYFQTNDEPYQIRYDTIVVN
jgi:hypothetical protein